MAKKLECIERLLEAQAKPALRNEDQLLTLSEACALVKKAKPTIYGLVNARKIPFMKQGKHLYFSKQELTDWIRKGSVAILPETEELVDTMLLNAKKKRR